MVDQQVRHLYVWPIKGCWQQEKECAVGKELIKKQLVIVFTSLGWFVGLVQDLYPEKKLLYVCLTSDFRWPFKTVFWLRLFIRRRQSIRLYLLKPFIVKFRFDGQWLLRRGRVHVSEPRGQCSNLAQLFLFSLLNNTSDKYIPYWCITTYFPSKCMPDLELNKPNMLVRMEFSMINESSYQNFNDSNSAVGFQASSISIWNEPWLSLEDKGLEFQLSPGMASARLSPKPYFVIA